MADASLVSEPRDPARGLALQSMVGPDLAPAPCPGLAVAQAQHVPRDVRPRLTVGSGAALHVVDHRRFDGVEVERCGRRCEEARVPVGHRGRMVIGGAPDHHAVDDGQVALDFVGAGDAAVGDEHQPREVTLQADDDVVPERRQLAVLLRADAVQPGVAGMDDKDVAATTLGDGADEIAHEVVALGTVDADAMLDGHRDRYRVAHRLDTVGDELRLGHQASPEGAALDALARAAAVEVDLVVAPALAEPGAGGEIGRLAAAELQCERMLGGPVEVEVAGDVAVQQRPGRHHLGVEARALGQQAMEKAAVAIGPRHHRRDREAPG